MSQQDRDLGLNNGVAVPASADMVADWDKRSAGMRARYSGHLDLRYGPRERNRIDFLKAADGGPTLLFIHGGYWQTRAKETFTVFADGPMAHGINVALIGYTLAPDATLDEIVAEIHRGLDFLAAQLPDLGGDPNRIVVSGWSAGGHLTSMALSHPQVKAGMAISGIYDLEPIRHSYLNVKLGLDEAMSQRNSPMMQAGGVLKPLSRCRQRRIAAAAQADRGFCGPSSEVWIAGDVRGDSGRKPFFHHGRIGVADGTDYDADPAAV
jgi:acetyl esterase/lipase